MDSDRSASSSFGTELIRFLRFYFGLFCVFLGCILISFWKKIKHCEQRGRWVKPRENKIWWPFEKTQESTQRSWRGQSEAGWERMLDSGPGGGMARTVLRGVSNSFFCFVFLLKGKGVFLARDKHHLSDICHLIRHDVPYLFQKYVKESHGKDIRVVVVGGQVIGSMLRCSTDGRMQSNCSLGEAPKLRVGLWSGGSHWGFSSGCFCCSVAQSTCLWPHGLQHTRLPSPSPSQDVCTQSRCLDPSYLIRPSARCQDHREELEASPFP